MTVSNHIPKEPRFPWKSLLLQTISFIRETPISWVFGFLLSLPILTIILLESALAQFQQEENPSLFAPRIALLLCVNIILYFISETGLTLSFRKQPRSIIEYIAGTGALLRWYFLFALTLLIFFTIFFSPLIIATKETQQTLEYVSFGFFLLVASISSIVKTFGEFYLLLSKLSLENALRSAATLLTNHFGISLFFFLGITGISLMTSFLLSALHGILHPPLLLTIQKSITLLLIIGIASFSALLLRTLWYFFFQTIAAEKPKDWQGEKKMVEESMSPITDEA